MIPENLFEKLESMASAIAEREGCLLYDLEFTGSGHGRVLRVFIDKMDGSVGVDECSRVSHGMNLLLDVEDLIPGGNYNLEVSTPGVERNLKKPWHFEKAIGKKIWVRTKTALDQLGNELPRFKGQKQVEGILNKFEQDSLVLSNAAGEVKIPLTDLSKAHVVFDFEESKGKKK